MPDSSKKKRPVRRRDRAPQHDIAEKKTEVLETVASGYSFAGSCRLLKLPESTVKHWRAVDKDFDKQVRELLLSEAHQKRIAGGKSFLAAADDWKKRFLIVFTRTLDHAEALIITGKKISDVEALLDPNSAEYDEEFSSEYAEISRLRGYQLRDAAMRKAVVEESPIMIRTLLKPDAPQAPTTQTNVFISGGDKPSWVENFLIERYGNAINITPRPERLSGPAGAVVGLDDGQEAGS